MDDWGNVAVWSSFADACRRHGILPGTWVTRGDWFGRLEPSDSAFMIAEDESPSDRAGILARHAEGLPSKPKAIIGNGWHDAGSKAQLAPLVAAGYHFITEMYARTDDGQVTGYTPVGLAFNANHNLGFPYARIQPCFGRFGGATEADYAHYKPASPGWSDYLVDNVIVNA
jgi:hypothetical protein